MIQSRAQMDNHILFFFIDGLGLGGDDPAVNPCLEAATPTLDRLFGPNWPTARRPIEHALGVLVPTDATLGVDGLPQSATGQATILTGRNASAEIGAHWGPWPGGNIQTILNEGNLFSAEWRTPPVLANPYPPEYHAAIGKGRRAFSSITYSANRAGVRFRDGNDLRLGEAASPDITNDFWRTRLNTPDMPIVTPAQAGVNLARLAQANHFTFYDHWITDFIGHRGTLEEAQTHLAKIDAMLGGVLDLWDHENGLLIVTSDHGNIEDKSTRAHTYYPVPTILFGRDAKAKATKINSLLDIANAVKT